MVEYCLTCLNHRNKKLPIATLCLIALMALGFSPMPSRLMQWDNAQNPISIRVAARFDSRPGAGGSPQSSLATALPARRDPGFSPKVFLAAANQGLLLFFTQDASSVG